jgi:Dolichyl-phosphate-mannose-protein mannosyltransferase
LTTFELAEHHPPRVGALRAYAWIAGWFLCGRAVVVGAAVCVHVFGPAGWTRHAERAHALGVLTAWDGRWYRIVASTGYLLVPGRQSDPAFFPLFPILLRAGHELGFGYSASGLVIANLSFLVALVAFYRLSRELLDEDLAHRATVYLALFPFGYVFSMVYPESLVLALVALAALAGLRGRWWLAAGCAAAATLARPEGAFVALPLLAIAWRQRRELTPIGRGLAAAAVAAPAVALGSFSLYLSRVVGDPLAWSEAQRAWGRRFEWLGVWRAFSDLGHDAGKNAWVIRDLVAVVVYLVLLAAAVRVGVSWPWLVGGTAIVVLPLFSGSFDSVGRFGLLAPAAFWGLAAIGRDRRLHRLILALSPPLLAAAVFTMPLAFP